MSFLTYDLLRALHILAVIAWMAGLMMLPRFYAYQCEAAPGGELDAKMIEAARRLRTIIITPAMILVWTFGIYLWAVYLVGDWSAGLIAGLTRTPPWFWAKLMLVTGLTGYHGYLVAEGRRLAQGERRRSARFWRLTNEAPFLAAIFVVLLATLEP